MHDNSYGADNLWLSRILLKSRLGTYNLIYDRNKVWRISE